MKLIIGTRGSALALWQSRFVAKSIQMACPEVAYVELVTIKTSGDKLLDVPLAKIGSKGLFTKEIEEALIDGNIDLAVHSMKDVPTDLPDGLHLAAAMKREDARDVFVSRDGRRLEDLNEGARIGTSSLRRRAFLLHGFPDLEAVPLRGNVDTRLRKIESDGLAGAVLAAAGMRRMGHGDRITQYLEPGFMVPAVGQGALAIETREDDSRVNMLVSSLNDQATAWCVAVERSFLKRMGGGCQVPLAAHCTMLGDRALLVAAVAHPEGSPVLKESWEGPVQDVSIGAQIAERLLDKGGDSILKSVLGSDWDARSEVGGC